MNLAFLQNMLPANMRYSLKSRLTMLACMCLLSVIFLYASDLYSLIKSVLGRELSSHGIFIPFISGYFVYIKRAALKKIKPQFDGFGIPFIALSIILYYSTVDCYQLRSLAFIVLVSGLAWTFLGRVFFKEIAFAFLFLITMIPMPTEIYDSLADITRRITFAGSSWIISLFGITFFKEGYVIYLPNAILRVVHSCSGVRYLVSYFVFSLAYSYLFRKTFWNRISIVALSIPLSLIASICRLTAIFSLTYIFGPQMAEYWPHVFVSWAIFLLILFSAMFLDQFYQMRHDKYCLYQRT